MAADDEHLRCSSSIASTVFRSVESTEIAPLLKSGNAILRDSESFSHRCLSELSSPAQLP